MPKRTRRPPSYLEPAHTILARLGGPAHVADMLGIHCTRVYAWRRSRTQRGTGGIIPQRYHVQLLAFARACRVKLAAEDFLPPDARRRARHGSQQHEAA